jgi:spore germination cell wall hydrolase CwlJ-like protein
MRQLIAVIVAACLLVSSCSMDRPVTPTTVGKLVIPISVKVDYMVDNDPIQLKTVMPTVSPTELNCLAKGIYYEARGESMAGMTAVGFVIMNRANDPSYPNTVCGVVTNTNVIHGKRFCQFSWYCDDGKHKLNVQISNIGYTKSIAVALGILTGMLDNNIDNAVSFHIRHLNTGWANHGMKLVATIGNHNFYEKRIPHG